MGKYDTRILEDFAQWLTSQLRLDEYENNGVSGSISRPWHRPGLRLAHRELESLRTDYKVREHMEQKSVDHIEKIAQRAAAIVLAELKKERDVN